MEALARTVTRQGALFRPKHFRITDPALVRRHIEQNSFGTLFTTYARKGDEEGSYCSPRVDVSHLPFIGVFDDATGELTKLRAHLAAGNPQFRSLRRIAEAQRERLEALEADQKSGVDSTGAAAGREKALDVAEVVVVFQGIHTYVSASWYSEDAEKRANSVPTWDYETVHVRCSGVTIEEEEAAQVDLLKALSDHNEEGLADQREMHGYEQWRVEAADKEMMEAEMKRIRFFSLDVRKVEAKFKLHQNHQEDTRSRTVAALHQLDPTSGAVADSIVRHTPK
mmetsp:Transcript_17348/g.67449  ORF Transcript_17348/g.67449 Transcript_17348/m.67449 type:complete len:282 (+) Transcript_17348:61-906(+)